MEWLSLLLRGFELGRTLYIMVCNLWILQMKNWESESPEKPSDMGHWEAGWAQRNFTDNTKLSSVGATSNSFKGGRPSDPWHKWKSLTDSKCLSNVEQSKLVWSPNDAALTKRFVGVLFSPLTVVYLPGMGAQILFKIIVRSHNLLIPSASHERRKSPLIMPEGPKPTRNISWGPISLCHRVK